MAKEYQDYFFRKAKKEGALSRAIFKLQEMDQRHHLIRPGSTVLDLGCAPGSWMQYAAQHAGKSGFVLGVDIIALPAIPAGTQFLRGDLFSLEPQDLLARIPKVPGVDNRRFDIVLSDAAPSTTGEKFVDQQNSLRIVRRALHIALAVLSPGGHFVLKVFQGPDSKEMLEICRKNFEEAHSEKPQSSRKESFEVYWVLQRRKRVI